MAGPYDGFLVFTDNEENVLTEVDVGWDNGVAVNLQVDAPGFDSVRGSIYRNTTQIGEFHYEQGLPPVVMWYIGEGVLNYVNHGDTLRAVIEEPFVYELALPVNRKQVQLSSLNGSADVVTQIESLTEVSAANRQVAYAITEINKVQSINLSRRHAYNVRNLEQYMAGTYPLASVPVYAYHETDKLQDALATLTPPSLLEIFNTWTRTNGNAYFLNGEGATGDAAAWLWNDTLQTVVQPINTSLFTAFISPEAVESYDAEVTVTSTSSDDDWISFVLAFHRDTETNLNHSLAVTISKGADNNAGTNPYPCYYIAKRMESNGRPNILTTNPFSDDAVGGWSGRQFRIWVKRRGDQFTVYGSGWDDLTRKPESLMTFNLNDDPDLEIYKGPKPYGYGATSQPNSSYSNLVFTGGVNHNVILDITNNRLYRYSDGAWGIVPDVTIHDVFNTPRTLLSVDTQSRYRLNHDGTIIVL